MSKQMSGNQTASEFSTFCSKRMADTSLNNISSSSSNDSDVSLEVQNKRSKSLAALVSKQFVCPITNLLMVDPVLAEDECTYERSAIVTWLRNHTTSPMVPSKTIYSSRLLSNRSLRGAIKVVIESGDIEEELLKEWLEIKGQLDLEKAKKFLREGDTLGAAKLGLPEAQGLMCEWYFFGSHDFEKDLDKAFYYATKAAEGGDIPGKNALGCMHFFGSGALAKDWVTAAKWFGKAALGGNCAMMRLGAMFLEGGNGLEQDFEAAFSWFKKEAEVFGSFDAQFQLAECYYLARGVPRDFTAARSWYKKSAAQEHLVAQYELGRMLLKGEGGHRSYVEGATLVGKAAELGLEIAKSVLNETAASPFSWYKKGAEGHGNLNAESTRLRIYYSTPNGVPEDLAAARSWYETRAPQEHDGAQYELARMMLKGEGGPQSYVDGAALLGKSLRSAQLSCVCCPHDLLTANYRKGDFYSSASHPFFCCGYLEQAELANRKKN